MRLWDQQLQDYRTQQAALQEQATKAAQDLATARKQIHQLNSKGDKKLEDDLPVEDVEENVGESSEDAEERENRIKLYNTMRAFASSIGVETGKVPPLVLDDDDEDLASPGRKRACAPSL